MNKQERKKLSDIASQLVDLVTEIEDAANAEREKFENMSEGLQQTDLGQRIEAAADALDNAMNRAQEAADAIEEAIGA